MDLVSEAIVKTLAYADIFNYPLKQPEIYRFLIWESDEKPPQKSELIPALFALAKDRVITQSQGYFYLTGKEGLVATRQKRQAISRKKINQAETISRRLAEIPTLLGIFLTGTLAMENADDDDDIDLMLVTKVNSLWTTRLKTTWVLERMGIRRQPQAKTTRDRVCANLYLDESALALNAGQRNLYAAHEVVQIKPLLVRNQIDRRFYQANAWTQSFLPHATMNDVGPTPHPSPVAASSTLFETAAFKFQYLYMKSKITREVVNRHAAFFHPQDTRSFVLERYHSQLQRLLPNSAS